MKKYKTKCEQLLPRSIRKEYEAGATMLQLAVKYHCSPPSVRSRLVGLGTEIRPAGSLSTGHKSRLSDQDLVTILDLDKQNVAHAEIARRINKVSRERIRQICAAAGHPVRRDRVPNKIEGLRAARIARSRARLELAQKVSEAWKSGAKKNELAQLLGDSTPVTNRITYYRSKYGPSMFPYRIKDHWSSLTPQQRAKRLQDMSIEWKKTGDYRHIQKRFGYSDLFTATNAIKIRRKAHPDLFPSKAELLKIKLKEYEQKDKTENQGG